MGEDLDLAWVGTDALERGIDRREHAARHVVRRRRGLGCVELGAVEHDRVGERSADVDTEQHSPRLSNTERTPVNPGPSGVGISPLRLRLRRSERSELALDRLGRGSWKLRALEGFLEMLVGGAVIAAGQRGALTRRALPGVRIALRRSAVEADALRQLGEELGREMNVALDHS